MKVVHLFRARRLGSDLFRKDVLGILKDGRVRQPRTEGPGKAASATIQLDNRGCQEGARMIWASGLAASKPGGEEGEDVLNRQAADAIEIGST